MPENAFNDDLDDDEIQPPNPVRDLRNQLKAKAAEEKALKAELDELKAFKAQQEAAARQAEIAKAFGEYGQPETAAKYFPADMEPTPENVTAYLRDFGIGVEQDEEAPASDFTPVTLGGAAGKRRISYEDYRKLLDSDPQAALKAVGEGRVDGLQNTPR